MGVLAHKKQKWNFFFWFEAFALLILIAIGIRLALLTIPKGETILVRMKLVNALPTNQVGALPFIDPKYAIPPWLIATVKEELQKSSTGQSTVQVLGVSSWGDAQKECWITLQLPVKHNKSRGTYTYNFQTLGVGETIRVNLSSVSISGVVTRIANDKDTLQEVGTSIIVKARLTDIANYNPDINGVLPYVSASFHEGDTMKTEDGVIAEVLQKNVLPAQRIVQNYSGMVIATSDPSREDVFLTLRLFVTNAQQNLYFLGDKPVRIGVTLPIALATSTIYPTITEIVSE